MSIRYALTALTLTLSGTAFAAAPGLLEQAERLLAAGRVTEAAHVFEQAARQAEKTHTDEEIAGEIGIVRSHWRAGEVRKALAYAHLVSGEHPDSMQALAWLALIEDRIGQPDAALGRLYEALSRRPNDAGLLSARSSLLNDPDLASIGLVVDTGRRVLMPWGMGRRTDGLCAVRSSDGRMHRAVVESIDAQAGLAVMRLLQSIDTPTTQISTARFVPGRRAFMLVAVAGDTMLGAGRPRLVDGLLTSDEDMTRAHFSATQSVNSGSVLVFDGEARLLAYGSDASGPEMTLSTMAGVKGFAPAANAAIQANRVGAEELYERVLQSVVYVQSCGAD